MPRIDFDNNRGENLADPKYDKDAVNKRTLRRGVKTIEDSFLALTGGTVNGNVTITGDTIVSGNTTIGGNTTIEGSLIVSGSTTTVGARFKKVREITITDGSWSGAGEPEPINGDDEIVFVTDNTVGGIPIDEFNIDLSNVINSSPVGRVIEIVNVDSGSAGLIIGAYALAIIGGGFTTYTINGVTGTPKVGICGTVYQSITIVKRADFEIVYYGTGL
jgi:hypothetical protein